MHRQGESVRQFVTSSWRPRANWWLRAAMWAGAAGSLFWAESTRAQAPFPELESPPAAILPVSQIELPAAGQLQEFLAQNSDLNIPVPTPLVDPEAPRISPAPTAEAWESMLKRLDDLEKKANAKPKDDKAKPAEKPAEKHAVGWLDLSTEKWTVKLGGHVQMDYINWAKASPSIVGDQDYFEFRRLRLLADGVGYGQFDFRIQIDIEPEAEVEDGSAGPVTVIKDAYFTMNDVPFFGKARIGNFFVPFSLEQVTNDTNNIFMERSIPTQGVFAADREVGIATYGVNDTKDFTWTTGIFFDSVSEALKERVDDNMGYRVSGRVTWLPYYDEVSNGRYLIHTGAGVLHTRDQNNQARFRARPQIHEGPRLIDSGNLAADNYTTGNVELATVWGQFSVQSEMFLCNVDMDNGQNPLLNGGYVYFSYFLTGENRIYERYGQHGAQFGRNVPNSNFFWVPGAVGRGAWELKSRMSFLNLNEVDRGRYEDLTVGANWYWTDRVRIMFDWIHPRTSQPAVFGATNSDILAMRFDYNF